MPRHQRAGSQAQALQGHEPKIPITYIGAKIMELPRSYPRAESRLITATHNLLKLHRHATAAA